MAALLALVIRFARGLYVTYRMAVAIGGSRSTSDGQNRP